ncbi:hypothetical protein IPF86_02085 [Candidatus Nomurabacteria bacterium]|jgi:orotate phosphoribosyltransferase|nr:MAG: hypothetical protein IPF86_02085 [Candidatus Nomurabacteria bacterium]
MAHEKPIMQIVNDQKNDPISIMHAIDGFYECPKDQGGKRLGPLVTYAGKYPLPDQTEKAYVGDIYINFAKAEEHPTLVHYFATQLKREISPALLEKITVFIGPQMGGIALALMLALVCTKRYACAEKKVKKARSEKEREETNLAFARHSIRKGDVTVIVEDVLNNFSTTEKTITEIEKNGGTVVAIVGAFNRSPSVKTEFKHGEQTIPVYSLWQKPFVEYVQEDPAVYADIKDGNIVTQTKDEWPILMQAMRDAKVLV